MGCKRFNHLNKFPKQNNVTFKLGKPSFIYIYIHMCVCSHSRNLNVDLKPQHSALHEAEAEQKQLPGTHQEPKEFGQCENGVSKGEQPRREQQKAQSDIEFKENDIGIGKMRLVQV